MTPRDQLTDYTAKASAAIAGDAAAADAKNVIQATFTSAGGTYVDKVPDPKTGLLATVSLDTTSHMFIRTPLPDLDSPLPAPVPPVTDPNAPPAGTVTTV